MSLNTDQIGALALKAVGVFLAGVLVCLGWQLGEKLWGFL